MFDRINLVEVLLTVEQNMPPYKHKLNNWQLKLNGSNVKVKKLINMYRPQQD